MSQLSRQLVKWLIPIIGIIAALTVALYILGMPSVQATKDYVSVSISTLAPPGTVHDWIGGVPAQTDNEHYDWVGGTVFVRLEVVAGGEPAAEVAPIKWEVGIIDVGTTAYTAIDYFTVTNTGGGAIDIEIKGTDATGGDDTWTLSDIETPGENIFCLYAGLDDDDDLYDIVIKKSSPYNPLVTGLGESESQDWGIELHMPTSVTGYDGQVMTSTVTLIVSAS